MARVRIIDELTIATQDVIPQISHTPINDVVMLVASGVPAIINSEYTVSGKTLTWSSANAGYSLGVGELVLADYEYDDGVLDGGGGPYDGSSSGSNQVFLNYNRIVIQEDVFPDLIHDPVMSTLLLKVNSVVIVRGVDYTISGRNVTWVSSTTLAVGDVVNMEYRKL